MEDFYTQWRVHSLTRPEDHTGLPGSSSRLNHSELEKLKVLFYIDDPDMVHRGLERDKEHYILHASCDGKTWVYIREVNPLPGVNPDTPDYDEYYEYEDEVDDRWGKCSRCDGNLTESENALGYLCVPCRDDEEEEYEALKEYEYDTRLFPEDRDDDDPYGDYRGPYDDDDDDEQSYIECDDCDDAPDGCPSCKSDDEPTATTHEPRKQPLRLKRYQKVLVGLACLRMRWFTAAK